jgi:hypothetical protein
LVNNTEIEYLYFTDVHGSWKVRSGAEPEENDPSKLPQLSGATAMDGLTEDNPGGCS